MTDIRWKLEDDKRIYAINPSRGVVSIGMYREQSIAGLCVRLPIGSFIFANGTKFLTADSEGYFNIRLYNIRRKSASIELDFDSTTDLFRHEDVPEDIHDYIRNNDCVTTEMLKRIQKIKQERINEWATKKIGILG